MNIKRFTFVFLLKDPWGKRRFKPPLRRFGCAPLFVSSSFVHSLITERRSCSKFAVFEIGEDGEPDEGAAAELCRGSDGHCLLTLTAPPCVSRLAVVTLPPTVQATHLPVFLSVVTSTLIAALLLTVSGVMISE